MANDEITLSTLLAEASALSVADDTCGACGVELDAVTRAIPSGVDVDTLPDAAQVHLLTDGGSVDTCGLCTIASALGAAADAQTDALRVAG